MGSYAVQCGRTSLGAALRADPAGANALPQCLASPDAEAIWTDAGYEPHSYADTIANPDATCGYLYPADFPAAESGTIARQRFARQLYFVGVFALLVCAFKYCLKNAIARGQASRVATAFSPRVWCSRKA